MSELATVENPSELVIPMEITRADVDRLEQNLFAVARETNLPEVVPAVVNHFGPGLYMREMILDAGVMVVGHAHKTEHFNILLSGTMRVVVDGFVEEMTGPKIVLSSPGKKKIGYAITDCRWLTIHPTHETDLSKLEEDLIEKSDAYLEHQNLKLIAS
jgi:hypothetical protein